MTTAPGWDSAVTRQPVTLVGRHVRLEPLVPAHAPDLYRAGQTPEIWAYLPRGPFTSEPDAAAWVHHTVATQAVEARLPFAIVFLATAQAIGSTSYFFETRWPNRSLEIGWTWLSPTYWRTAVNTEAKYLLLRHAFEALGAYRVELMTDARNLRSQRAIERLGASREGLARSHMICPDGFRRDSVLYSLLDHEWPTVKARLEAMLARSA